MDWARGQRGYPLGTEATGSSEGKRAAGCSDGTGPAIEEWRIPQKVPSSGEDVVGKCKAPDASKGQAMTSPVKSRASSFIAVDVMKSFGIPCRERKVLARRASPLCTPNLAGGRSRSFGEMHIPDGSGAPLQSQAPHPVERAVR